MYSFVFNGDFTMQTYTTPAGHIFRFVSTKPYTRKDGTQTTLAVWASKCRHPGCTKQFEVTVPASAPPENCAAFGAAHCAEHKLTRAETTKRWVDACTKTNTKATPEVLSVITAAYEGGASPQDIALLVPVGVTRIYQLVKIHKLKRKPTK
jgi:hypothetical protein